MADGPAKAPTAPTELTRAMAAPAALPLRRLAARLQNIGSEARIPIAARLNPATARGTEWASAAATKPMVDAKNKYGNVRNPLRRLAHSIAIAPKPKVTEAHHPVDTSDAPWTLRILGSQKVRP